MKSIIIIPITLVLLIAITVLILSSNDSLAPHVLSTVSYSFGVVIIFTIPILIILYVSKNKGIIKNNIVKNILKGYGLLFLGLIVVGITSASFTHDEVNIKPEKVNEEIKNKLPSKISEIIPSKMGNGWYQTDEQEVYYDHAEKLLEKYVLTYKGKDHVGLDMQDAMLIALTNKCGFDVMLDKSNTETWVSVSDELDNKDKLTVMMNTKSDVLCANTPAYWFDVYLHTGKITSESDSLGGSQILLDYLDTSN